MNQEETTASKQQDKTNKGNVKREIFQWIQSLIVSVIVVALIVTFVGRVMSVKGSSMVPTLEENDRIIATNLYKNLKHGDIVVIKRKNDTPLIKRVIAIESEKVEINFETGEVFVNGILQEEPYISEPTQTNLGVQYPATVPKGHVFVMGDNRNHSLDSRDPKVGMIDERNIFGKVIFRIFPFDKVGSINAK